MSNVKEIIKMKKSKRKFGSAVPKNLPKVNVICPFHEEETPSCSVDLKTVRFKCLGCGAHGSLTSVETYSFPPGFVFNLVRDQGEGEPSAPLTRPDL